MYECLFGVYLPEDGGDFENEWTDSFSYNSRAIYKPAATSYFRRLTITSDRTDVDILVPRASTSPSTFNLFDVDFDLAGKLVNVDEDYTINMRRGSYNNTRIDGLFRGTASATPGAPVSNGEAKFNFYNVHFPNITIGQGRSNINAKLLFQECIIKYEEQPFGEDCGDQRYVNCDITCTNASSSYLVTVGSGNNCELIDCTLRNIELPFRYFLTYPATGTIVFGNNKLLGTSTYSASNLLANMSWTTAGYTEVPLLRTNDGSPADGTLVYIDSDVTTDPIKRKRVGGVWVDIVVPSGTFAGIIESNGSSANLPAGWSSSRNSQGDYAVSMNISVTGAAYSVVFSLSGSPSQFSVPRIRNQLNGNFNYVVENVNGGTVDAKVNFILSLI